MNVSSLDPQLGPNLYTASTSGGFLAGWHSGSNEGDSGPGGGHSGLGGGT